MKSASCVVRVLTSLLGPVSIVCALTRQFNSRRVRRPAGLAGYRYGNGAPARGNPRVPLNGDQKWTDQSGVEAAPRGTGGWARSDVTLVAPAPDLARWRQAS
jgi:hypothetical protein